MKTWASLAYAVTGVTAREKTKKKMKIPTHALSKNDFDGNPALYNPRLIVLLLLLLYASNDRVDSMTLPSDPGLRKRETYILRNDPRRKNTGGIEPRGRQLRDCREPSRNAGGTHFTILMKGLG
jgi:hypothetical protein